MPVKSSLLIILPAAALSLTSCTTLENRRDMYFPQQVNGPYTRMAKEWGDTKHPVIRKTDLSSIRYKTVRVSVDPYSGGSGKDYVAPAN